MAIDIKEVCTLRQQNPCLTLIEIGDQLGVTRERVRQILKKEGMSTRALYVPKYGRFSCVVCDKVFVPERATSTRLYCSVQCQKEAAMITLSCDWCGNLFKRPIYKEKPTLARHPGKNVFCNKHCYGSWFGYTLWRQDSPEPL